MSVHFKAVITTGGRDYPHTTGEKYSPSVEHFDCTVKLNNFKASTFLHVNHTGQGSLPRQIYTAR